jgi:ectoine hydroxylase-related dioxygenase (phytanoyl-CoA dioxygenase family)
MSAVQIATDGYHVLKSVFNNEEIEHFRQLSINGKGLMGQTRSASHSRHLAGFHRFPHFADCHAAILSNPIINSVLKQYFGNGSYYAIGLSDITVNRSQQWHTDLLRGKFREYLHEDTLWAKNTKGCIKALVYLQSGKSLRIVPGSHLQPTPLDDTELDILARSADHVQLEIQAGDVVMMDIRSLHRGSTDEEMSSTLLEQSPKILLSTVFGQLNSPFAQSMELGNMYRMINWDQKYLA